MRADFYTMKFGQHRRGWRHAQRALVEWLQGKCLRTKSKINHWIPGSSPGCCPNPLRPVRAVFSTLKNMTFEGRECFASWRSVAIEGNLFYCLACGGSIRCYCDEDAKKVIQGDNRGMDSVHDLEMQALIAAERERCAKVAESCMDGGMDPHNEWDCGIMDACVEIAARIRASGPSRI